MQVKWRCLSLANLWNKIPEKLKPTKNLNTIKLDLKEHLKNLKIPILYNSFLVLVNSSSRRFEEKSLQYFVPLVYIWFAGIEVTTSDWSKGIAIKKTVRKTSSIENNWWM